MNLQQRLTKGCKGCPFFVMLSGSHLPEFSRAKDQSCLPKSGVFCNHFFSFLKPRSRTVLAKWGLNTHRNFETSCRVRCGKERNCFCMSFFSWLLLIVKTCQNNMQRKHLWQLRGWLRGEITGVTADRTCQYGPTACQSPQARAWFPPQATEVLGAVWRSFGAPKRSKCSLVLLAPCVFRFKNSLPPALNSPLIRQYTLDNIEWIYAEDWDLPGQEKKISDWNINSFSEVRSFLSCRIQKCLILLTCSTRHNEQHWFCFCTEVEPRFDHGTGTNGGISLSYWCHGAAKSHATSSTLLSYLELLVCIKRCQKETDLFCETASSVKWLQGQSPAAYLSTAAQFPLDEARWRTSTRLLCKYCSCVDDSVCV